MSDEYLSKFLSHDELGNIIDNKAGLPDWVNDKNSSKAAYLAILELYAEKMKYIQSHSKKTHFKKKADYTLSKSEVARAIGKNKPNALFHSVDYSAGLTDLFDEKQKQLLSAFEKTLNRNRKGKQGYTKTKLVSRLNKTEIELRMISEQTAEMALEKAIARLPIDIRRKLGLQVTGFN